MHARIDQLLSLRDGELVEASVAAHVAECADCAEHLQKLKRSAARLRELGPFDAPAAAWDQIRGRLAHPVTRRSNWHVGAIVTAAGVATLAIAAALLLSADRSAQQVFTTPEVPQTREPPISSTTNDVSQLVDRSQQLEQLLQVLPERPAVQRVSLAATIDTIERRIQWLDFQLSYAPDAPLSEQQARRLWGERVELMDSLVKVRYAEAGHFSF